MVASLSSLSLADPIATALLTYCPAGPATESHLRRVLTGAVGRPGKLVRARLVHEAARSHGHDDDDALRLACAIEYFHLASLLLDDLPCMDNAQTRRGEPCAHRVHGEASTILAALALINRAYALAGMAFVDQPGFVRVQAHASLDACLGAAGLVGGQARDLRFAEGDRSVREIGRIALGKTGALFWLALVLPALSGDPSPAERRALKALCVYWGLAFQALDDLRDVLGSSVESGKTTGRDRALTRPNLALALGVPATRRRLARLSELAGRALSPLRAQGGRWGYLVEFQDGFFAEQTAAAARAA
jgi:geranylgeranyl pyrophosphate synthase